MRISGRKFDAFSGQWGKSTRILAKAGLWAGPVLSGGILMVFPDSLFFRTIALLVWMTVWWFTQAVPLAVTALLPLVIAPLLNLASVSEISGTYARPPIFLFLGGFMLAIALEKHRVPHRLLEELLRRIPDSLASSPGFLVWLLGGIAFVLSMWISNTATVLILLPLLVSLPVQGIRSWLALAVAYSATLGGMTTPVGTPPNAFFFGIAEEGGHPLSFTEWIGLALPLALILETGILLWFSLQVQKQRNAFKKLGNGDLRRFFSFEPEKKEKFPKFPWGLVAIFGIVVGLWIFRSPLSQWLSPIPLSDSMIAIAGAILLAIFRWIDLPDWKRVPWDALLIFGGGFALSHLLQKHQVGAWIQEVLSPLGEEHPGLFFAVWIGTTILLTEVASNTATSAILSPLAMQSGEFHLGVAVTLSASCAFMLPVATMPNLLVFSSGLVSAGHMLRIGAVLNFMAFLLLLLWTLWNQPG